MNPSLKKLGLLTSCFVLGITLLTAKEAKAAFENELGAQAPLGFTEELNILPEELNIPPEPQQVPEPATIIGFIGLATFIAKTRKRSQEN
ncbi:MAG: PEP-CTERM sorting domain-containing protein [Cyanobacteria bacterium J06592_8]